MLERDGYPAGVPCWVDTAQPDSDAALAFYGGVFGWEFEERTPAGSDQRYHVAQLRGRDVQFLDAPINARPESRPGPAGDGLEYDRFDAAVDLDFEGHRFS